MGRRPVMLTMKRKGISGLVALVAVVTLLGGSALAGAYVHGSICQASSGVTNYGVNLLGVTNGSTTSALSVFCPSPIDHDVGASLQWQAHVSDFNSASEVRCEGAAI